MAVRGGRPFKKGQSGNAKGSSARKRMLGAITKLTNEQVLEVGSLLLEGNTEALHIMARSSDHSVLKVWMASLIIKSVEEGDAGIFNVLMTRFLGKPPETKTVLGADGGPLNVRISEETDEEKLARAEHLRAFRLSINGDI